MSDTATLAREIDTLELLLAQVAKVTGSGDQDGRLTLVKLRRELANQVAVVGQAAERVFVDTEDYDLCRAKLSHIRSLTAMHQAAWPAVMLGERKDEFHASAQPMRDNNREFIAWARAAVARHAAKS